jgi:hypothetical protein
MDDTHLPAPAAAGPLLVTQRSTELNRPTRRKRFSFMASDLVATAAGAMTTRIDVVLAPSRR